MAPEEPALGQRDNEQVYGAFRADDEQEPSRYRHHANGSRKGCCQQEGGHCQDKSDRNRQRRARAVGPCACSAGPEREDNE